MSGTTDLASDTQYCTVMTILLISVRVVFYSVQVVGPYVVTPVMDYHAFLYGVTEIMYSVALYCTMLYSTKFFNKQNNRADYGFWGHKRL